MQDYCDLHLSRISHLILYLIRNFTGKVFSLLIINLISTNNYTQLATCLDSIRLRHTRIVFLKQVNWYFKPEQWRKVERYSCLIWENL